MDKKLTSHITAVGALVVFIVLGLACASFSNTAIVPNDIKKGESEVWSAVYSKDGKFLIIGDARKNSIIAKYDAKTGKLVKKFDKIKNNGYPNLLLSEDGRSLLVWYNSSEENPDPCIYDVESGKLLHRISKRGTGYFVSPDGFKVMNTTRKDRDLTITISDSTGVISKEINVPDHFHIMVDKFVRNHISEDGRFYDSFGYALQPKNNATDETIWIIGHVDLENPNSTSYIRSNLDYFETFHRNNSIAYSPDGKYMAIRFYQSVFPRLELPKRVEQANAATRTVLPSFYDSTTNYLFALNNRVRPFGLSVNDSGRYEWLKEVGVRVYKLDSINGIDELELVGETLYSENTEASSNWWGTMAFSNDSKTLYVSNIVRGRKGTLGSNGKWQFSSMEDLRSFLGFTPDGKQMLIRGYDRIRFIDLE